MKIVLAAADSKFIHSNLALRYLKAHGKKEGRNLVLKEFTINDNEDKVTEELYLEDGDIYVFSVYIWNLDFLTKVINNLKVIKPNALFLCGGPEVYFNPSESFKILPCDIIMEGEGEETFSELLDEFDKYGFGEVISGEVIGNEKFLEGDINTLLNIPGLYINDNNKILYSGKRQGPELSKVIFPYDDEDIEKLEHRLVYYEAQRGCPYRCAYCLSSVEKNIRKRPLEMVFKELDYFIKKKVPLVKFVDRTFNMDDEYARKIVNHILSRKNELKEDMITSFHFEISAAILSDKFMELFSKMPQNVIQIEAGIQSTNRQVLNNVNRFDNFYETDKKLREILSCGNIHVHTDLIAGLPGEDEESFIKGFNEAMDMRPHMLQLGFLKVLKGTDINKNKEKYGIIHRQYPPYEVIKTRDMDYNFMIKLKRIENIVDTMWNSGKFYNYMSELLTRYQNKFELFLKMSEKIYKNKIVNNSRKDEKYYSFNIDYIRENFPSEIEFFTDLIRFDHIIKDRSGWFPDILGGTKYNSVPKVFIDPEDPTKRLKGTISRFKIRIKDDYGIEFSPEESYFWYSLQTDKIYEVAKDSGDFHVIQEHNYKK